MKCSRCQHENEAGAKFCEECAAPLARTCTGCGRQLSPTAKFCPECAHPTGLVAAPLPAQRFGSPESYTPKHLAERILTSKTALEGERKQITVLFADLKGSMELLADRDPEEARKILDPILELMMEAVHRYEGTVNQVMGDGIMALFGAPLAQEDHAVRACYAALRLRDAMKRYGDEAFQMHGVAVQVRAGLNSGEVVVRAIGSDLRMDYAAVGQTTHLAARMEQMATPGTVLLTPHTLALAEGFVQVVARGRVPVKGLPEPMDVYELTGASPVRSRLHSAAARGLTRFVGRDSELDLLRRALERVSQGQGQVVAVVGEPGVGKSRLVWEFTHSHRTRDWLVIETASVSYGKASTYLPIVELLRTYFGIESQDEPRKVRERVTGKLLALDRALEPTLPVFLWLLDALADDPEWTRLDPTQRRRRTIDALKLLLLRESQMQPVLLSVEDLHWIDGETQAVLDTLVESLPTARLLLLVNFRPEYEHVWGRKTYYQQVRLDALLTESAADFLAGLLGTDPGLAELGRLLVERTQGNPFFLEESVRALVEMQALVGERGGYRLAGPLRTPQLPPSVQAVLAARIDRLAPEDKRLLQTAAVIGKDVPWMLLRAVADEQDDEQLHAVLSRLQAAEFLYEARLFPDLELTFKHALTHEVAYAGLVHERRRSLHGRVLTAIEALHGERVALYVERLAQHALHAEQWEKAVAYFRQAGKKSIGRHAFRDVPEHLDHALEALRHLPQTPDTMTVGVDTRLELVPALFGLSRLGSLVEHLREAERVSRLLDDRQRLAAVLAHLSWGLRSTGHLVEAVKAGEEALAVAVELQAPVRQAQAKYYLGQAYFAMSNIGRALAIWSEVIETAPRTATVGGAVPVHVSTRSWLAVALSAKGEFAGAIRHGGDALRLADEDGRPFGVIIALGGLGAAYVTKGDFEPGIPLLERGLALCHSAGIPNWSSTIGGALARAYARLGRVAEALPIAEDAVREDQASGTPVNLAHRLADFAEVCMVAGRLADALAQTEEALNLARRHGDRRNEASDLHLLGEIHMRLNSTESTQPEMYLREALTIADELGMRPLVAHCHLGLGTLYRHVGKREQAREHLTTATTMYRAMDMRHWLENAEAEVRTFQ